MSRRGSVLIVTLWLVAILSAVAVALGRYLSVEVKLAKFRQAREQARALARSGVYLAMQRLAEDAEQDQVDWLGDDWAVIPGAAPDADPAEWIIQAGTPERGEGAAVVAIRVTDEARRLSLNAATRQPLERLLAPIGGTPELAQAIIDHVDADPEAPVEEPPYTPKNAPIVSLDELSEIPGMTAQLMTSLRPLVAAVPVEGQAALNINTAERDVLLALAGDQVVADIDSWVQGRAGNGAFGDDDDCRVTQTAPLTIIPASCEPYRPMLEALKTQMAPVAAWTESSAVFRIESEARLDAPEVRYHIEAIVTRQDGGSFGPQILAWKEG